MEPRLWDPIYKIFTKIFLAQDIYSQSTQKSCQDVTTFEMCMGVGILLILLELAGILGIGIAGREYKYRRYRV